MKRIYNKEMPLFSIVKRKCSGKIRNVIKVRKRSDYNFIALSRYLMEKKIGRKLRSNEVVHHINRNKLDDRIENLKLMTNSEHDKLHMKDRLVEHLQILKKRWQKYRDSFKKDIYRLRSDGCSFKKISEEVGISHNTVQKILKEK